VFRTRRCELFKRYVLPLLQVLEGSDLLDPRNDTEQKKLKKVTTRQHMKQCAGWIRLPTLTLYRHVQSAACMFALNGCRCTLQKPDSFRLACQLNVGDGENSGTLRFRTKPK
jgi:hypothetical protein